jgi:nitronate monooxygenase
MIGTISLVPQVSDLKIPVIASGGIMDGRGIAAALALGASAVQLGTAFLTCHEAGVPDSYKKALLAGQANQTRITRAFSGRPARGLTNRFLAEMESRSETILPFPIQNSMTRLMRSEAARLDSPDYLSLWAGQGVGLARNISATDLIEQLHLETEHAINLFARCNSEGTTE